MLEWASRRCAAAPSIERIVVALPPGVGAPAGHDGVPGGEQRSLSVRDALRARRRRRCRCVVHDAARPLVTPELVEDCLAALAPRTATRRSPPRR